MEIFARNGAVLVCLGHKGVGVTHRSVVLRLRGPFIAFSPCRGTRDVGLGNRLDSLRDLNCHVPQHHLEDVFVFGEVFEFPGLAVGFEGLFGLFLGVSGWVLFDVAEEEDELGTDVFGFERRFFCRREGHFEDALEGFLVIEFWML